MQLNFWCQHWNERFLTLCPCSASCEEELEPKLVPESPFGPAGPWSPFSPLSPFSPVEPEGENKSEAPLGMVNLMWKKLKNTNCYNVKHWITPGYLITEGGVSLRKISQSHVSDRPVQSFTSLRPHHNTTINKSTTSYLFEDIFPIHFQLTSLGVSHWEIEPTLVLHERPKAKTMAIKHIYNY